MNELECQGDGQGNPALDLLWLHQDKASNRLEGEVLLTYNRGDYM